MSKMTAKKAAGKSKPEKESGVVSIANPVPTDNRARASAEYWSIREPIARALPAAEHGSLATVVAAAAVPYGDEVLEGLLRTIVRRATLLKFAAEASDDSSAFYEVLSDELESLRLTAEAALEIVERCGGFWPTVARVSDTPMGLHVETIDAAAEE